MKKQTVSHHFKYPVPQFKLALLREKEGKKFGLFRPTDVEEFVEPLKHCSEEFFVAFHLNCKNHVIGYHEVSHGTLTSSLVHPREVFKAALLSNANSLIVAHNHPTGELEPSFEDIETTQKLVAAGEILGVPLVDHVIVSINGMFSIRESRPSLFN